MTRKQGSFINKCEIEPKQVIQFPLGFISDKTKSSSPRSCILYLAERYKIQLSA